MVKWLFGYYILNKCRYINGLQDIITVTTTVTTNFKSVTFRSGGMCIAKSKKIKANKERFIEVVMLDG